MPEQDPIARYKDLCIDAVDIRQAGRFWGAVLGLKVSGRKTISLTGPTPLHRIWINEVSEDKTVKNRAHLDVLAGSLAELTELGARILEPAAGDRRWTVMADPDGQEFCAFLRKEVPDYRLYEVVVDAADPQSIARWWAEVFGVQVEQAEGYCYLTVPGAPFPALTFVPVPEAKTVKKRVHWDVRADPDRLVQAGARLVRPKGGGIRWQVLADPDGNEFCVFAN